MVFSMVFTSLVVVFAIFYFLGWSFLKWRDGYKNAGVRMSFGEFQRIYELAPSRWDRYSDYSYCREEWIPTYDTRKEIRGTFICTNIAMRTLFDFWRLFLWEKRCKRKYEREERFKNEKTFLKNLSIMVEKDAEDIRREIEEKEQEAENLRQEIIDRLGGDK